MAHPQSIAHRSPGPQPILSEPDVAERTLARQSSRSARPAESGPSWLRLRRLSRRPVEPEEAEARILGSVPPISRLTHGTSPETTHAWYFRGNDASTVITTWEDIFHARADARNRHSLRAIAANRVSEHGVPGSKFREFSDHRIAKEPPPLLMGNFWGFHAGIFGDSRNLHYSAGQPVSPLHDRHATHGSIHSLGSPPDGTARLSNVGR